MDCLEFGEVEIADGLQGIGDGAVVQFGRQGVQPGGILGLQCGQIGDGVAPALGAAATVG